MNIALTILCRIALPIVAAALVAILELLILNPSALRPTLILFLATLPSIIAYVLREQLAPARIKLGHALFLAPVVLIAGLCLAAQVAPLAYFDVAGLYRWILLGYLLQITAAHVVLILAGRRRSQLK